MFQRSLVQVVRENSDIFSSQFPGKDLDANARPSSSFSPAAATASSIPWTGLPVIFDEVFTGLYRLGRFSSSSFLEIHPDISVHAKLLTGGLVPLCTTLASESIFEDFLSSQKSDALLHGHSYTAHAVGCKVAETSLKMMLDMDKQGSWDEFRQLWSEPLNSDAGKIRGSSTWSTWSRKFVCDVSHSKEAESVIALGSVLAISLLDQAGTGE
jgi:bifunctional dethiobiotin synthetase / adenosylmethionine---8-amino-7-oxononanoate aminotransferase